MKLGICLSGGGGKGAYQVGVLEELVRHKMIKNPHAIVGCSVGAINTLAFVNNPDFSIAVEFMSNCWDKLTHRTDVWKFKFPPVISAAWSPSIGSNEPLRNLLTGLVSHPPPKWSGPKLEVIAWNLLDGNEKYFSLLDAKDRQELISMVMASSSFPLMFPPESLQGGYWTDGGISTIAPANRLIQLGCDTIIAIVCRDTKVQYSITKEQLNNIVRVGTRCLDGMESAIVDGDLKMINMWNLLVDSKHPEAKNKKHIKLMVISPNESLGDPLDFNYDLVQKRKQIGRNSAIEFIKYLKTN